MSDYLTITMTERLPVRINKKEWTTIADVKDYPAPDGSDFCEIKVRTKENDAYLVHGTYDNNHPEFPDCVRHGFLVYKIEDVPQAIKKVQELLDISPKLAHICISQLPPVLI